MFLDGGVRKLTDWQFRVWCAVLTAANLQDRGGEIHGIHEALMGVLHDRHNQIMRAVSSLHELRLVSHGGSDNPDILVVMNWEKYQASKTSTERVRRHREKKKTEGNVSGNAYSTSEHSKAKQDILENPEFDPLWGAKNREDTQCEHALSCWVYFSGQHKVRKGDERQCADLAHALLNKYDQLSKPWHSYRLVITGIQRAHGSNTREKLTWKWVELNCHYEMEDFMKTGSISAEGETEWQRFIRGG